MKIRTAFVSNSSSASFIINKNYLTEEQITKIRTYVEDEKCPESWYLNENDNTMNMFTVMDNGNLYQFLKE